MSFCISQNLHNYKDKEHYALLRELFNIYTYTLRNTGNGCQSVSPTSGWSKKVSSEVYYYSANVLTLKKHQIFFKTVQTLHQNYFDISLFWFHLCCVWCKILQFINRQTYRSPSTRFCYLPLCINVKTTWPRPLTENYSMCTVFPRP
jgi:hypothetical protein